VGKWQIFLLVVLAIAITTLMLVTWGSVGSALCAFLLIIMVVAILYRKLVLERDEDTFDWDV
jgi:Flp pilus assembly protein TadB